MTSSCLVNEMVHHRVYHSKISMGKQFVSTSPAMLNMAIPSYDDFRSAKPWVSVCLRCCSHAFEFANRWLHRAVAVNPPCTTKTPRLKSRIPATLTCAKRPSKRNTSSKMQDVPPSFVVDEVMKLLSCSFPYRICSSAQAPISAPEALSLANHRS